MNKSVILSSQLYKSFNNLHLEVVAVHLLIENLIHQLQDLFKPGLTFNRAYMVIFFSRWHNASQVY